MSGRAELRRRQFHIVVFAGPRARDLAGMVAAIAYTEGEALQQAWDYVRDNWTTNPAMFEYRAIPLPRTRRQRQTLRSSEKRGRRA